MNQHLPSHPADQADYAGLPCLDVVDALDAEGLIALATRASAVHARAMARLTAMGRDRVSGVADDGYLTVEDVAAILKVSPEWVYRKAAGWSFAVKLAPKVLRIQRAGLFRWMAQRHR